MAGKPIITVPRGPQFDYRGWAAALTAANQRIEALEAKVQALTAIQALSNAPDGVLVITKGQITSKVLKAAGGLTIKFPDGAAGPPTFSVP